MKKQMLSLSVLCSLLVAGILAKADDFDYHKYGEAVSPKVISNVQVSGTVETTLGLGGETTGVILIPANRAQWFQLDFGSVKENIAHTRELLKKTITVKGTFKIFVTSDAGEQHVLVVESYTVGN